MNLLRIFILCLICVSAVESVSSQVVVTPSKKKTVIEGKTYYLHTVKQGETLYSISKAYNVLQKDIVIANPSAFEGIKVGEELKIPVKSEDTPVSNQLESAQFIYHIAEKGQTVFYLTQHYQVSTEELYRYNPELEHSPLQAGQVVTIPKAKPDEMQTVKPAPAYLIHKVKRKETLFSISKNYDVDLNHILEINPEIDANNPNIKIGQDIKIPLPEDTESIGIPVGTVFADTIVIRKDIEVPPPATDSPSYGTPADFFEQPVIIEDSTDCIQTSQNEFRIAMLMPLFLAANSPASPPDSSLVKDTNGRFRYKNGQYWINLRSVNALEFYEGALLAIDSLKKQGMNAKVYVYDTMRDTEKLDQILNNQTMKEMDMIIGPFYSELVDQAARFARQNGIYYISPMAVNQASLKNNPYLIQVNSGDINTVHPVIDFIAKQENVHVTLIGNKSESDQTLFNAYHNNLKTIFADSSLTIHRFRMDSLQQPTSYLKKHKLNAVIIPSGEEAFVNVVAAQLNTMTHHYQVNLYGLASWTRFANIDLEYFHTLELRYATAFHIDYNRPDVRLFLQQFRKYYHTEPTILRSGGNISSNMFQHAFLGYDVTFYFLSALKKYGKEFGYCIPGFRMPMLQSDFHFQKIDPFSGYINTRLDIYKYTKEYTVVKEDVQN